MAIFYLFNSHAKTLMKFILLAFHFNYYNFAIVPFNIQTTIAEPGGIRNDLSAHQGAQVEQAVTFLRGNAPGLKLTELH